MSGQVAAGRIISVWHLPDLLSSFLKRLCYQGNWTDSLLEAGLVCCNIELCVLGCSLFRYIMEAIILISLSYGSSLW